MIKGVIFDFDGTLFNTNQIIKESFKYTIKEVLQREVKEQEIKQIWGEPLDQQMKHFSRDKYKVLVDTYRRYYLNHDRGQQTFPGAVETLKQLSAKGVKIAILTNKSREGLLRGLKAFKLEKTVDFWLSKDDLTRNKPDPEGFNKIRQKFNLQSNQLLMVGDSPSDILGGKNAGIRTVLVSYTFFELDDMLALKPDFVIDSLNQVLQIVEEEGFKKNII